MKNVFISAPTSADISVQQMVGRLAKQTSMPENAVCLYAGASVSSGESQKVGRALRKPHPVTIKRYNATAK